MITIQVDGGVVQDVQGLPDGWTYSIKDNDENIDNHDTDPTSVRITVEGGVVTEVENLPDDMGYEVEDGD